MVKLKKLGIKGKIWEVIDDCHCSNESTVAVNGATSQWFEIKQDVRQGGVLSGFLYCVFINDLLNCRLENVDTKFGVHEPGVSRRHSLYQFKPCGITKNVKGCIYMYVFMFMALYV